MVLQRRAWIGVMVVCLYAIFAAHGALGLVVQPKETTIAQYDSLQETVITILNDEFSPRGCDMAIDYRSAYLEQYVHIDPDQFVIQPQEEVNVQVTTQFPAGFAPQEHRLRIIPCQGDETAEIVFHPPGTRQQAVVIEGVHEELSADELALTITVNLKNTGNVYVFVTPELFIKKEGELVKNVTYPRPIVIGPGELYPLTLRHDTSELAPGSYAADMRVAYATEEETLYTDSYTTPFRIEEHQAVVVKSGNTAWFAIGLSIIILVGGAWWLFGKKKKEKHLRPEPAMRPAGRDPREEVRLLRQEVDTLTKDIRLFVEEADRWLEQRRVS